MTEAGSEKEERFENRRFLGQGLGRVTIRKAISTLSQEKDHTAEHSYEAYPSRIAICVDSCRRHRPTLGFPSRRHSGSSSSLHHRVFILLDPVLLNSLFPILLLLPNVIPTRSQSTRAQLNSRLRLVPPRSAFIFHRVSASKPILIRKHHPSQTSLHDLDGRLADLPIANLRHRSQSAKATALIKLSSAQLHAVPLHLRTSAYHSITLPRSHFLSRPVKPPKSRLSRPPSHLFVPGVLSTSHFTASKCTSSAAEES